MIGQRRSALDFKGSGGRLRLRVAPAPEPLSTVSELCRGALALEKALGEALKAAADAGHGWTEIGQTLRVGGTTAAEVRERYEASRRSARARLWPPEQPAWPP